MIVRRKATVGGLLERLAKPRLTAPAASLGGGPEGPGGEDGRSAGILYTFSTDTANSDPGAGKLKLNNASADAATIIRISETDGDGAAQGPYIDTWDDSTSTIKGTLIIRSETNPTRFIIKQVTAQADAGAYRNLTVEATGDVVNGTLENNESIVVQFYRTGDTGGEGKEGKEGKEGAAGSATMNGYKEPCRVATTANITIPTALNNGDSLDGVTLVTGDRVLVKDQTTTKENGIWVVGATPTRATDADQAGELRGGTTVYVEAGTANGDRMFRVITNGSITPGTTAHDWAPLSDGGIVETETNGAATTNVVTVSHALGTVPRSITMTRITSEGSSILVQPIVITGSVTTTQFKMRAIGSIALAAGQVLSFYWHADLE